MQDEATGAGSSSKRSSSEPGQNQTLSTSGGGGFIGRLKNLGKTGKKAGDMTLGSPGLGGGVNASDGPSTGEVFFSLRAAVFCVNYCI